MSETSIIAIVKLLLDSVVTPILVALTALFSAAVLRRVNQNTTSIEKAKVVIGSIETAVTDTKRELTDNTRKTETVVAQNKEIHDLVNSTASKNETELKQVQTEFKQFVANELQKARDEIAQLRNVVVTNGSASTPKALVNTVEGASPAASLKRIDQHTEQIEKNTASTEAKVEALKEQTE